MKRTTFLTAAIMAFSLPATVMAKPVDWTPVLSSLENGCDQSTVILAIQDSFKYQAPKLRLREPYQSSVVKTTKGQKASKANKPFGDYESSVYIKDGFYYGLPLERITYYFDNYGSSFLVFELALNAPLSKSKQQLKSKNVRYKKVWNEVSEAMDYAVVEGNSNKTYVRCYL